MATVTVTKSKEENDRPYYHGERKGDAYSITKSDVTMEFTESEILWLNEQIRRLTTASGGTTVPGPYGVIS